MAAQRRRVCSLAIYSSWSVAQIEIVAKVFRRWGGSTTYSSRSYVSLTHASGKPHNDSELRSRWSIRSCRIRTVYAQGHLITGVSNHHDRRMSRGRRGRTTGATPLLSWPGWPLPQPSLYKRANDKFDNNNNR